MFREYDYVEGGTLVYDVRTEHRALTEGQGECAGEGVDEEVTELVPVNSVG